MEIQSNGAPAAYPALAATVVPGCSTLPDAERVMLAISAFGPVRVPPTGSDKVSGRKTV